MSCMHDCLVRIYEFGSPKNFQTLEATPYIFHPVPKDVSNYKELVSRGQALIDALATRVDDCEAGCECVRDETQVKPYPKASETVTRYGWLGLIRFEYTVKFTTYTGQCDDISEGALKPPPPEKRKR